MGPRVGGMETGVLSGTRVQIEVCSAITEHTYVRVSNRLEKKYPKYVMNSTF